MVCIQHKNCKIWNNSTQCDSCQVGFKTTFSVCVSTDSNYSPIANCRVMTALSANTSECSICEENYQISSGSCVYQYTTCPDVNSCSSCITGYSPSTASDYSTCSPNVSNCVTMKSGSASECQTCQDGFELTSSNTVCSIKAANVTAYPKCNKFYTNSFQDVCIGCEDGYVYHDYLTQCISLIPHCISYSDASTCSTCKLGFSKSDGACVPSISNCQTFSDSSNCSNCQAGFELFSDADNGNTKRCRKTDKMFGCDIIWESEYCFKCKVGFSLKNNICFPSMSISSFSDSGKCSTSSDCKTGYSCDTSPFSCQPGNCSAFHDDHPSKCKTCNTNFQLISGNGNCQNTISDCSVPSSSELGSCETCASGYTKYR